jgi:uncharacterized membrane protein
MPDEFVWAVAKALAIVCCSVLIVLYLAWIAYKKCFPESDSLPPEEKDQAAGNAKTKRPTAA